MEIKSSLLNSDDMRFTKASLLNVTENEKNESDGEFRVDVVEYVNDASDSNDDEFFYEMVTHIRFLPSNNESVAYTDRNTLIWLNCPNGGEGFIGKNIRQWDFVYCHECLHQLWDTFGVEDQLIKEGVKMDHYIMNVASDCVINDFLEFGRKKPMLSQGITAKLIKEKFGVDYDRKKDTQYTFYLKLMEVADKVKKDPTCQQANKDNDAGEQNGGSSSGNSGGGNSGGGNSGGSDGQNQPNQSNESAHDAAQRAQNAADKAQEAANEAKKNGDPDADKKQAAADKAQEAADKAQEAANKASEAAKKGDGKAENAAKEAGASDGKGDGSAQDAADEAGNDAKEAQEAADEAKKNGDSDANEKQKAADEAKEAAKEAQEAADKAKEAKENGDSEEEKNQTQKAKEAAEKAKKAANKAKGGKSGKGNGQGQGKGVHIEGIETEEDLAKIREEGKQLIERYKNRVGGEFGTFLEKCESSAKMEENGLIVQATKAVSYWNDQLEQKCNAYIKNRIFLKQREYKRTYQKVKRGSGFVQFGQPIQRGKKLKDDKLIINVAFYIDRSGSMGGTLDGVFKAAYIIAESLDKTFGKVNVVGGTDFAMFAFDDYMQKVQWGKKMSTGGSTMDFDEILSYIVDNTNNFMINIILTDAEFNVNENKIEDFLKKVDGLVVFITNSTTSNVKYIAQKENNKTKLVYIQADSNFEISK